jgi:hypothetical protein
MIMVTPLTKSIVSKARQNEMAALANGKEIDGCVILFFDLVHGFDTSLAFSGASGKTDGVSGKHRQLFIASGRDSLGLGG